METGLAAPTAPTRHPTYYFPDCNVVFMVNNVLYRLSIGTQTGSSDENPIIVPNISTEEFDHFLDYQLRHLVSKSDEKALTSILKVTHFLQYDEPQTMAQTALEALPNFDLVTKLTLGFRTNIVPWVTTAFTKLALLASDRTLSWLEAEQLGFGPYRALMETRWEIVAHRRRLAYSFPEMVAHADDCKDNFDCEWGWRTEWKGKVVLYLIQPDTPVLGSQVLTLLETTDMRDVNGACRVKMVNTIRRSGILAYEDSLIEQALATLIPPS
ncbi:hypothetical protein OH76DRAFT_1483410 [Lentinus brumalis]|uniref:BTB domain-containing protein n=1 Tax=Lentinus brumalis TaxID=2498619 RepID=A0A371D8P6_9APHY|nr:hypothetical protein OH76DRAFT_1483410 [Polyporus brumalis]